MAWDVEMTAPVIRFSWIVPEVVRVMNKMEVMFIARDMPKRIPVIMFHLFAYVVKLLYKVCLL